MGLAYISSADGSNYSKVVGSSCEINYFIDMPENDNQLHNLTQMIEWHI